MNAKMSAIPHGFDPGDDNDDDFCPTEDDIPYPNLS